MEIFMLKQTVYKGDTLRPGDKANIDDKTANRWLKNKIALQVMETGGQEVVEDGNILGVCNDNPTSNVSGDSSEKPAIRRRKVAKTGK